MSDPAAVSAVRDALSPVPGGAAVILAVSGGADSTGMAHLVRAARPDLQAAVVHVRHGLRDDAPDARAAAAHAASLGIGCRVVEVTVTADGTGPENAARSARLRALTTAARDAGAGYVLTGHTADDQAETVLLNIARGSGLSGAAGIPPVRTLADGVLLLRPVLALRRETVHAVAAATGVPVAQDPTNSDEAQRRARARHDVLPRLANLTGGGTDPVEALARLARHARRDAAALDTLAGAHAESLVRRWGPVVALPSDAVAALPAAIAGRIVHQALARICGAGAVAQATVNAVLALADGQAVSLPGGAAASRGGGCLALVPAAAPLTARRITGDRAQVPEAGVVVRRGSSADTAVLPPWAPRHAAAAVPTTAAAALLVRPRQPGDRLTTAAGTQSVATAMSDAGVPRVARPLLPVIEDEAGVLWVPGVAVRAGAAGPLRLWLEPTGAQ